MTKRGCIMTFVAGGEEGVRELVKQSVGAK